MAFPFLKIRCAVGGCRMSFLFRQLGMARHAAMSVCRHVFMPSCCHACLSAWWHVGIRNTCLGHPVVSPRTCWRVWKRWIWHITHWYIAWYALNLSSTNAWCPTNGNEKKKWGQNRMLLRSLFIVRWALLAFCWECILLYINILLYIFNNSTEYYRLSNSPLVTV